MSLTSEDVFATPGSERAQTTVNLLQSWETLSASKFVAHLDPSFEHHSLPESINAPFRDYEDFSAFSQKALNFFTSWSLHPRAVFEDTQKNTVIVYATMTGEIKTVGPWLSEAIFWITWNDQGKIVRMREFVDASKVGGLKRAVYADADVEKSSTERKSAHPTLP